MKKENNGNPNQRVGEGTPLLVNAAQVATMLSISKREVERMVADGRLPRPIRLGKRLVRWNLATLRRWITELEKSANT